MATVFKIKRGLKTNLPPSALEGEPLFCTDTEEFFIGKGSGNPLVQIGNDGLFVNVKKFGAKGDGVTDDTIAIQNAINSLQDGQCLVFPPNNYKTTKTLFINKDNINVYGYGAKIINTSNSMAILAIHGGVALANDTELANFLKSNSYGQEIKNVNIYGLTGEMSPNTSGGSNLGFIMVYADNCKFEDLQLISSNGNGIEVRQCTSSKVVNCKVSGHKNYGIFVFQSKRCFIFNNKVIGGSRGIITKQTYNGEPITNHIVEKNHLVDINTNLYWIVGGEWYENVLTDPIYVEGHEIVGNNIIRDNRLERINGSQAPCISLGSFSNRWQVINNILINNGQTSGLAMTIGSQGNPLTGGTSGRNHLIKDNQFINYSSTNAPLIEVATDCEITNNHFTGKTKYLIKTINFNIPFETLVFSDNKIDLGLSLNILGNLGVKITTDVGVFIMKNNNATITPVENGANTILAFLYCESPFSIITNNSIIVKKDASATLHDYSQGFYLNGINGGIVTENNITVDSPVAVYGFDVRQNYNISNNNFKIPSDTTSTTSRAIYINAESKVINNSFNGSWINTLFDNTGMGIQLGFKRIVYASAIPSTGTWAKGDIVYNTNPIAGGYVGWICILGGTSGTWKGFGLIQA